MSEWREVKLRDILKLSYGKGLPKNVRVGGSYPVYGSSGIIDHHIVGIVEGPSIIVGRKGNVGSVFYEEQDCFPIDTVYYINKTENDEDLKYIYYLLKTIGIKDLNSDAAVPGLNREQAHSVTFSIPDYNTQKELSQIVSNYDDLIKNNTNRIQRLEEIAQRLYNEWFVHFRFPGHEGVKMVDSGTEYGEIPEGWEVHFIKDAVEINPKTNIKTNEESQIKHIGMECLSESVSIVDTRLIELRDKSSGPKFHNRDTLFARITPCLENGKTAYVTFLDKEEVATGSTEFIVFREKELTSGYIYFLARDDFFRESAKGAMVGASGRQRVHASFFDKFKIVVPPADLLYEFETQAQPLLLLMNQYNKQNNDLSHIRDLLISQLITGRRQLKDNN